MKRIFITSALILACALIHAQHISEEDALAYASEFFQGRATSQLSNPSARRKAHRRSFLQGPSVWNIHRQWPEGGGSMSLGAHEG